MKLQKALKLKKSLIGDITKLKQQITVKNSYLIGSLNAENCDVKSLYETLINKINELTSLKYIINEANREIQSKIFMLGEYKALISFWNDVSVEEGTKMVGYSDATREYKVHFTEKERDELIAEIQLKVDAIQEQIDTYNYTTDIPWGEEPDTNEIENKID